MSSYPPPAPADAVEVVICDGCGRIVAWLPNADLLAAVAVVASHRCSPNTPEVPWTPEALDRLALRACYRSRWENPCNAIGVITTWLWPSHLRADHPIIRLLDRVACWLHDRDDRWHERLAALPAEDRPVGRSTAVLDGE